MAGLLSGAGFANSNGMNSRSFPTPPESDFEGGSKQDFFAEFKKMQQAIDDLQKDRDRDRAEIKTVNDKLKNMQDKYDELHRDLQRSRRTIRDLEQLTKKHKKVFDAPENKDLKEDFEAAFRTDREGQRIKESVGREMENDDDWWKVVALAAIGGFLGFVIGGAAGCYVGTKTAIGLVGGGAIGATVGTVGLAVGGVAVACLTKKPQKKKIN